MRSCHGCCSGVTGKLGQEPETDGNTSCDPTHHFCISRGTFVRIGICTGIRVDIVGMASDWGLWVNTAGVGAALANPAEPPLFGTSLPTP